MKSNREASEGKITLSFVKSHLEIFLRIGLQPCKDSDSRQGPVAFKFQRQTCELD